MGYEDALSGGQAVGLEHVGGAQGFEEAVAFVDGVGRHGHEAGGFIQLLLSNASHCCRLAGIIIMSFIGGIISVSFIIAAWRSDKAIDMLFAYWDQIRCETGMKIKDYYPISPISKNIIYNYFMNSYDKNNDDSIWEHDIAKRMHIGGFDKWINKCDILMPYKFLPWLFLFCWIFLLVLVWVFSKDVLSVDKIGNSLSCYSRWCFSR